MKEPSEVQQLTEPGGAEEHGAKPELKGRRQRLSQGHGGMRRSDRIETPGQRQRLEDLRVSYLVLLSGEHWERAKELEGTIGGRAERLSGFGWRGLGGISNYTSESELGGTSGDAGDSRLGRNTEVWCRELKHIENTHSHSQLVFHLLLPVEGVKLQDIPSYSTSNLTGRGDFAGSRAWLAWTPGWFLVLASAQALPPEFESGIAGAKNGKVQNLPCVSQ